MGNDLCILIKIITHSFEGKCKKIMHWYGRHNNIDLYLYHI